MIRSRRFRKQGLCSLGLVGVAYVLLLLFYGSLDFEVSYFKLDLGSVFGQGLQSVHGKKSV